MPGNEKPLRVQSEVRVRASPCTNCGKMLDAANAVKETTSEQRRKVFPSPGDFTICIDCGHVMAFTEDLILRDPTPLEIVKIAGDRRLLALQWARGRVRKDKP